MACVVDTVACSDVRPMMLYNCTKVASLQDDHCMAVPTPLMDASALAEPHDNWHSAIRRCAAV